MDKGFKGFGSLKKTELTSISIFLLVSLYLAIRAFMVPLVHDEVATFFYYVQKGVFLPPHAHWDANNHLLNSLLSYFSYSFFGSSEFSLRLSNLIFFPVFFFFVYRISNLLRNPVLKWTFFITFIFAHNFIEYFALSRGYGMSMALLFASIYYVFQVFKKGELKYYIFSTLFISLAISANLTLVNTGILISSILGFHIILNYKENQLHHSIKAIIIILVSGIIPLILAGKLLLQFKAKGLLYYGTLDGFWELTVRSLVKLILGQESWMAEVIIAFFSLAIIILFLYRIFKSPSLKELWKVEFIFLYLLVGNFAAVMIMSYLLQVNFPEDRTGLYFFPFFMGSLIFLWDSVWERMNHYVRFLLMLPFLFFPIHFLMSLNISHSSFWRKELIPQRFYDAILEGKNIIGENPSIGAYQIRTLCFAYQNYSHGGLLNQIQSSHYPELISDFQIVDLSKHEEWLTYYDLLGTEPISNLSLLKRKAKLEASLIAEKSISNKGQIENAFYNIYRGSFENIDESSLKINLKVKLTTEESPFIGRIVAELRDLDNKLLEYESIALDWNRGNWKKDKNEMTGSLYLHQLPKGISKIVVYIWNVDQRPYILESVDFKMVQIELQESLYLEYKE
ncbi:MULTISPECIES: hypothetical protein [unclassified Lentimicrobium]|uniref:hypothetical protein n=1 Tax=unclassified Lentimicrobium TaxID=2677434 RepID=UPI0015555667|nr:MULTISPECIES: hypothetical protein [unclassified Lentimicrobium]NPD44612.1 hypothetical protein [Lentimicrobium sp. S6]NPD83324.1 hypothetical protein [Lentimicrobium sp. L6]